jgi:hypothetical protein
MASRVLFTLDIPEAGYTFQFTSPNDVAPISTPNYDAFTMNHYWRTYGRAALALLLVASLTIIVIHWHRDSRGQDCGLCAAQHLPTLQSPAGKVLVAPTTQEWVDFLLEVTLIHSGIVLFESGRAPPQVFISL